MSGPKLVYDDDCEVCTRAAVFIDRHADVELVGFSALTDELRASLPDDFERCAHLVDGGRIYSCGAAMERAYERTKLPPSRLLPLFRRIPGYGLVREGIYRIVATNRPTIGRLFR